MGENWERINEALGAEMQGGSLAPHVSRQTLFGIKSDIETQMETIAAEVARGAEGPAAKAAREELCEVAGHLGDRLVIGRADRYYIWRARGAGYDIPAYPFSKKGELAVFLQDQGAADLPGWYARLGVTPAQYRNLAAYAILALSDGRGDYRERVVSHVAMYVDDSRFLPLAEDPFLELAPAQVVEALLAALRDLV